MLKEIFLKKSSTVNNSIITLGDTDDSGKGRHFKSRFIQPGVAGYPGQFGNVLITKESLDKFINTMVGVPVVINHKDITKDNADDERVGVVNSVWYDDKDGWYWCDGIIWNETAQNLITDKKWNVSCSYDVLTANDEGGTENNIKYDMEFLDGVFTHLALVNNPRYERANIVFNSKTVIENYREDQKRNERGQWIKDNTLIQQKKDNLIPIKVDPKDIPQFKSKEELGNWFKNIFEELGSVTITDTGIKIDLYGGNAEREAFKRRLQQEPNKAVAKAFEDVITKSIKIDERKKDDSHKHDQDIYFNKLKLGEDNYDVNLFIDYLEPNREYRYAGHKTTKIDNEISTRDTQVINHIMLTKVDNSIINDVDEDFNPNVKEHEDMNNVDNGWITLDETDENGERKKIWIPENVHYVKPSERDRVLKICDAYKEGDEPIYNFEHTRVKPTEEQIQYLKDTVKGINDSYSYKGIAQIEISSSLNNGSWGVCFSPNNTSLISIAPSMYKENAQEKYDKSIENGFHPKGTGEAIKSVLVHEIGHAITCNSKDEKFWGKIDKLRSEYLKTISKDDIDNPDFISNYARENRYEFVAEAFCQGHLSKKYGKYTRQVMDLMKEHFSKKLAKATNAKDEGDDDMWIEGFGFGYPIDETEYEKFRKDMNEEKEKDQKKSKADNSKEQDMALIEELKKLITKVENDKGEDMEDKEIKEVENEKVDKRKLIDEVGGILKGKVDDEIIRTIIGKMEKMSYDDSEESADNKKAKNEKEDDKEVECSKKVKNEDAEDKEKVEEVKEDIKEDVDNKCKNSKDFFNKINEIYNTSVEVKEQGYVSRAEREQAAIDYFK